MDMREALLSIANSYPTTDEGAWMLSEAIRAALPVAQGEAVACDHCGGSGADLPGRACWKCIGTGEAKAASPYAYECDVFRTNFSGDSYWQSGLFSAEFVGSCRPHNVRNKKPLYAAPPASRIADFIDEAAADVPADAMLTARAEQAEEELRCADVRIAELERALAESREREELAEAKLVILRKQIKKYAEPDDYAPHPWTDGDRRWFHDCKSRNRYTRSFSVHIESCPSCGMRSPKALAQEKNDE